MFITISFFVKLIINKDSNNNIFLEKLYNQKNIILQKFQNFIRNHLIVSGGSNNINNLIKSKSKINNIYKHRDGNLYYIKNKDSCPKLNINNNNNNNNYYYYNFKNNYDFDVHVFGKSLVHILDIEEAPDYSMLCYGRKIHSKLPCKLNFCSAVVTPYNLIPGGGEKYLLSIVRAMQKMGEFVDIYVLPDNVCRDKKCAESTANAVNVNIDWTRANILKISTNRTHFLPRHNPTYRLFALLGNSAIPMRKGLGQMNVYMNQFPFDGGRKFGHTDSLILSSYDFVVLNSYYTRDWYINYTINVFEKLKKIKIVPPMPIVVYPPVTVSNLNKKNLLTKLRKPWIVLTGRFFDSTQGKRHLLAIEIFKLMKLSSKLDKSAKLYLMGYQMPGYEAYTQKVKLEASKVPGVHVLVNINSTYMRQILSQSIITWSLTGGFDFSAKHHPADS